MEQIIDLLNRPLFGAYDHDYAVVALLFGVFWYVVYNVYVLWQVNGICKDKKTFDIIPISISQSYYMIPVRWLFQMFMFSSIAAIFFIGQNWLYFIVCALFTMMTLNPSVNSGNIYFIPHMIGAISATVIAILGLGLTFGLWWMVWIAALTTCGFAVSRILAKDKEHVVYYVEQAAFISLLLGFAIATL